MGGHRSTVERLLWEGANPAHSLKRAYAPYTEGDTAVEIAKKSGQPELQAIL